MAVVADEGDCSQSCVYCPVRPTDEPPSWWKPTRARSDVPLLGAPIADLIMVWLVAPLMPPPCAWRALHCTVHLACSSTLHLPRPCKVLAPT
jgi:hypothetical protein